MTIKELFQIAGVLLVALFLIGGILLPLSLMHLGEGDDTHD